MAIDGVEDTFVRAVVAKCCYHVFVAAILYLIFDKEKSGPEVVDLFSRLLLCARESTYVWVGGWNWIRTLTRSMIRSLKVFQT